MKLMFRLSSAILTHFWPFDPEKYLAKLFWLFISRPVRDWSYLNQMTETRFLFFSSIILMCTVSKKKCIKNILVFVTFSKIVMVLRWVRAEIWAVELDQAWGGVHPECNSAMGRFFVCIHVFLLVFTLYFQYYVCMCACLSVYVDIWVSVCLSVCLSVSLSVWQCLSVWFHVFLD